MAARKRWFVHIILMSKGLMQNNFLMPTITTTREPEREIRPKPRTRSGFLGLFSIRFNFPVSDLLNALSQIQWSSKEAGLPC